MEYRIEHDLLGEKQVPADVYWGVHTQRALENFPEQGCKVSLELVRSMALVKKASALTNVELGYLDEAVAKAIGEVCDEVITGKWDDQFPLDALQGGAGTSTNMNVNEVVANRANEVLGGQRGVYDRVHPLDHVNLHQSTNDVYPTALKVAAIRLLRELSGVLAGLQGALQRKEKEFAGIVKIGRTEMQEAVPMTLGSEFAGFAEAIARDRWRTFKCEERLRVVNIGGTAIGTGLGAPRDHIFLVIEKLRELSGMGLTRGEHPIGETANADVFVEVSGIVKAHAVNVVKISNDLRLLNMLKEVSLPQLQAGSSIMPGKVNPVLLEAAIQTGLKVMADDQLIAQAACRASLQINEFLPLLADAFLGSLKRLIAMDQRLLEHINGIQANEEQCRYYFDRSRMIVTAFVPFLGYAQCQTLLKEFDGHGSDDLRSFLVDKLGKDEVDRVLAPHNLVSLGYKQ